MSNMVRCTDPAANPIQSKMGPIVGGGGGKSCHHPHYYNGVVLPQETFQQVWLALRS